MDAMLFASSELQKEKTPVLMFPFNSPRASWILPWLWAFGVEIENSIQLHCLAIPKRGSSTKKTKPNIEKWSESREVELQF